MTMITSSPLSNLQSICQPEGGLTGRIRNLRAEPDGPRFILQMIEMGDLSQASPRSCGARPGHGIVGMGVGLDLSETTIPSLGESLERYCTSVFTGDQFITASADDLGSHALDLESIPVCSATELAHPRCPLIAPDKKAPIRWVRGISLLDGRLVYLPVVMVYVHAGCASPDERFWFQISTGCAAHASYERAIIAAIFEVIERDAISITWLQELPLSRIRVDILPSDLAPYWEAYERSSSEVEHFFFDATTDMGIPTIYGVHVARGNKHSMTFVGCSTAARPAEAIIKVMRDLVACSMFHRGARPAPESWDDFTGITEGAAYMARAERLPAFDFLLKSNRDRRLSEIAPLNNSEHSLQALLNIFRKNNMDVYAVDLTTDEALRVGVRVVRVLIPGLQPVGFQYRARYLGHSRLYDAPRKMGYRVHAESKLNHWPQPFS